MTDVYIAYAREDREKVRILSDMLRFEGWDVWVDPSSPTEDNSAAIDLKLGSAGAILVVWSGYSRGSEQVRSEAATGLYKNKLIQVRVDQAAPPRPFDQVEVIDLGMWSGEREDPNWRRIVSSVRLYAGAPGASRPQATRRATSGPAYLEPARSIAWGPLVAAGVLVVAGAGVWLADPFGWREPQVTTAANDTVATSATTPMEGAAVVETSSAMFEDTEQSTAEWGRVNRSSADGLRAYVAAFPRASSAETARSLLRVMDAQAWVHAVTADNESGYQAYLEEFPVDASMPGAMAAAARDRLVSLSAERSQAIEDIQRGLLVLKFYKGDVDGKAGNGTARAVKDFATSRNRTFPTLSTAAPRDLRAFAEIVSKAAGTLPSSRTPIVATATTPVKPATAEDADRDRIAKAQAAIQAASKAATETAATQAAVSSGSDSGAVSELQKMADQNAWADAEKVGTLAAYQNYLVAHPSGAQTAAAKAAVTRLSRPAPYSLELVPAEVKAAADAARKAQASANSRAAQARETAAAADSAPGAREIVAADGDKYQTQISGGAPNGLGVRLSGGAGNAGDRYRGELRNGQTAGLGVYEYANNPGNSSSGALRYEGEHSSDAASGYGVTYWKNGDSFAGLGNGPNGLGRGVLTFSNGQRYEGEMRNGTRNGYGVVWSADGSILMAGRWVNGELVEPAAKPDGQ